MPQDKEKVKQNDCLDESIRLLEKQCACPASSFYPHNIPDDLKMLNQWVVYKLVPNPDPSKKDIKCPLSISTGYGASTSDPDTWSSYSDALTWYSEWGGHPHSHIDARQGEMTGIVTGLGYVFSPDDPYCGIDLDHCIDEQGKLKQWAQDIVDMLESYTEISVSGTGLHVIIAGQKPDNARCRHGNIECYDQGRYFCLTGNLYKGGSHVQ
jgi:putative DNA primase/helicase